jgi:hypothetical protein
VNQKIEARPFKGLTLLCLTHSISQLQQERSSRHFRIFKETQVKTVILLSSLLFTPIVSFAKDEAKAREPYSVVLDKKGFKIDGKYRLLRGGSVQWFRLPESTWEDRLRKYKDMGFNALDIYIAWNQIEPREGEFNFDQPNLRRFLELAQSFGLYVAVRPGPYITNEMDGGGLPAWLTRYATKKSYEEDGRPNLRTYDPDFINPVRRYLNALNEVLKPYMADQGGPIVLYVIENEYNWFERSFDTDKIFYYEGGFERPLFQQKETAKYFTALRDIVRQSGVKIPLVTCPGDGRISAMGDVPDVIPFPNIYEWAHEGQPEEIAYDLLKEMHDPTKHGGIYQNVSSGSMELNRNTQESRRLIMGGLDSLFTFNLAGMIQQGYMNSLTMGARAGDVPPHWGPPDEKPNDWLGTIFDFSDPQRYTSAFVAPLAGYFGNIIDYDGPLSASGVQRDLYYQYRRDNFFFNLIENLLGASGLPFRSGNFEGADPRLQVQNMDLGARQRIGQVHYWHEVEGTSFISLVNQSGKPQIVEKGGLVFKGESLPRFRPLTVPLAQEKSSTYDLILLHNYALSPNVTLHYATSEVLTVREFDDERLLIVYGSASSMGELALKAPGLQLLSKSEGVVLEESRADGMTISYAHGPGKVALFRDAFGKKLRVYVTDTDQAGRIWFLKKDQADIMIAGLDDVERLNAERYRIQFNGRAGSLEMLSAGNVQIEGLDELTAFDPDSRMTRLKKPGLPELPQLPEFSRALTRSDRAETQSDFDDSSWLSVEGQPKALEFLDIFGGHAWYRTRFEIKDAKSIQKMNRLYIESASDIVGVYVNGLYLATLNPFGTVIDNQSSNSRYRFQGLSPFLKVGENTITFRTEVWGHGSFMFGRGTIIGTRARMPALPYDGLKGLHGKARIGDLPLTQWKIGTQLGGERAGYMKPNLDLTGWTSRDGRSLSLEKGDIVWYRSDFATHELPRPDQWAAPLVLRLQGSGVKATIFLNGQMIGRWISDEKWLQKGFWGRPQRGMWVGLSADEFPVPYEMLNHDGRPNTLAIAFEDTSTDQDPAGLVKDISLQFNHEGMEWRNDSVQRTLGVKGVGSITLR